MTITKEHRLIGTTIVIVILLLGMILSFIQHKIWEGYLEFLSAFLFFILYKSQNLNDEYHSTVKQLLELATDQNKHLQEISGHKPIKIV